MGIVRKQSIEYSLIYYFGLILGYLNTVILFPSMLAPDEFGLTRILLSLSIVIAQFAQLGTNSMVIRYYAVLKEKIFSLGIIICSGGLLILMSLIYLFRMSVISFYNNDAQLFADYYLLIIPFTIAIAYFNLFDAYLRSIYKSIFTAFLSNVFLRLIWTILIVFLSLEIIDFQIFIIFYSWSYAIITSISLIYIKLHKKGAISFHFDREEKVSFKKISNFNLFTLAAGLSIFLISKIDIIMLGSIKNLEILGVYAIAAYMAMVIKVPASSIGITAQVITAHAFKNNDLRAISKLYQKTSITQFILSAGIFILMLANFQNITFFLHERYAGSLQVFLYLGLAQVIDSAMGINGAIMINSKYYRSETFFSIVLLIVTVVTNYLLIPIYGGTGAALATLFSIFLYNLFRLIYIKIKLKMSPFNANTIIGTGICIFTFFVGNAIPQFNNFMVDASIRSLIILSIFILSVYWAKLSPEINKVLIDLVARLKQQVK